MKTENKLVYKCDHCGKWYLNKGHAVRHEKMCFHNPENKRPCFNCKHLVKKDTHVEYEYGNQPYTLLFCEAKQCFTYTPKNELKKNIIELGDDQQPMPKECELFSNDVTFEDLIR